MRDMFRAQNEERNRRETALRVKVENFEKALVRVGNFMDGHDVWWGHQKEDLISLLNASFISSSTFDARFNTEADHLKNMVLTTMDESWVGAERFINNTMAEFRKFIEEKWLAIQKLNGASKTAYEKLEVGQKLLETKVANMENFLGTPQGTSLEKVMEIVNVTEETTRTYNKREMEVMEQRLMDKLTAKMAQELRKQVRREEDLEDLKKAMEENHRKQLGLALEPVGKNLLAEQKARKALEKELSVLKAKCDRMGGGPPPWKKLRHHP